MIIEISHKSLFPSNISIALESDLIYKVLFIVLISFVQRTKVLRVVRQQMEIVCLELSL